MRGKAGQVGNRPGRLAQQHRVELDGHAERTHQLDALQNGIHDAGAACDAALQLGVGSVKADVDAVQTRVRQLAAIAGQQRAVCGHRHLFHAGDALELRHEPGGAEAHERLPARHAHMLHAERGKEPRKAQELLIAQNVPVLDHVAAVRHTVAAPEVAAVGYGEAQIIYITSELVGHFSSP